MYQANKVAAALMILVGSAGCGGDGGGPVGPTPQEIAGIYSLCALTFDPEGDLLSTVDVMDRGIELEGVRHPQLQVDASRGFQILLTPEGQFVERSLLGTYLQSGNRLRLTFAGGTASPADFLLPPTLELAFQQTPKSLTTAATPVYEVDRATYARLAGQSESGLAERIPGKLMAAFKAGDCS